MEICLLLVLAALYKICIDKRPLCRNSAANGQMHGLIEHPILVDV